MLTAAIANGCHYVDICDDWEPTIGMMGLDQDALNDVLAIMWEQVLNPNLLARLVCEELETVEDLLLSGLLMQENEEMLLRKQ